ncbi:MAG: glycosyl hydrolase family 28 protein [Chitinophagaceae bacterium]
MVLRGSCIGVQKPVYLPGRGVYEYPYTPQTFPWFYDKKRWLQYLDSMVENRMNSLYLWNSHPFASLVKLKEYPYAVEAREATFKKNEEMYRFLTKEADKRGINCIFDGTERGIRIKTARGRGGVVEDIRVDNIIMKNIRDQAIVLDMQYAKTKPEAVSERTPQFRNIHFSNIMAQTKDTIFITGLEEMPVEDISFNDIQFDAQRGAGIKEANNIEFHNVRIICKEGSSITAENVKNLTISNLKTLNPLSSVTAISLTNSQNIFVYTCFPVKGTDLFIQLKGSQTKQVTLKANNFIFFKKPLKDEAITENIVVE